MRWRWVLSGALPLPKGRGRLGSARWLGVDGVEVVGELVEEAVSPGGGCVGGGLVVGGGVEVEGDEHLVVEAQDGVCPFGPVGVEFDPSWPTRGSSWWGIGRSRGRADVAVLSGWSSPIVGRGS